MVQGRQKKPAGDAGAFRHIVILEPCAVIELTLALDEDDDQPARLFQMRLVFGCADRLQRPQPFAAGTAVIEAPLLFLGGIADPAFHRRIGDSNEVPWLVIGAGGPCSGGADASLNHLLQHRPVRIVAHGVALFYPVMEGRCLSKALLRRIVEAVGKIDRLLGDVVSGKQCPAPSVAASYPTS